ncbi:MAG: nitrite reductase small subunit NirD [Actinophytocola sp.]|uniref:nitrite reductase small subunit NirD n=1 Tax=Actinophytocola sp. TaxID=1872138 RepID=UPI0013224AD5|nr:nitrite reductase small subunit NirD [Actinophytocola sp.]MPZ82842.1 nitrite reductase small subunit NirD [Actinophytocola sp.]
MTALSTWTAVCALSDLLPGRGVAALLPDGAQIALFRADELHAGTYALSNVDPFSGAAVLSRGIVGDLGGAPVVASPMHKQHFDLRSGVCVEDGSASVRVYPVRVADGVLMVGAAPPPRN